MQYNHVTSAPERKTAILTSSLDSSTARSIGVTPCCLDLKSNTSLRGKRLIYGNSVGMTKTQNGCILSKPQNFVDTCVKRHAHIPCKLFIFPASVLTRPRPKQVSSRLRRAWWRMRCHELRKVAISNLPISTICGDFGKTKLMQLKLCGVSISPRNYSGINS